MIGIRKRRMISIQFLALWPASVVALQQASQPPDGMIRVNSDLVVVDVVVTDAQNRPVHHLAPSNFTLLEDGRPQTVTVFEEHETKPAAETAPLPKLQPGTFTNYTPVSADGALNILLLDKLNTPMDAQTFVRDQVLKYLKEMPAGTRLAIFSLTTRLQMLQGFTSDPEVLRALVEGKKTLPDGSPLLADDTTSGQLADFLGNSPDGATVLASLQQFEAQEQSFQQQLRARYTLDAFNLLARYLSTLPGRKNVIWFSGSFPINIMPDGNLPNPFAVMASSEAEFRETTDILTRSQVAVYPIDARGLMTTPMFNAANSGRQYVRNPGAFTSDNAAFHQQTAQEQATMNQMAEATGGKSFVDTNGLKEAVAEAIEAGSNYYTLAYRPANRNWNGNYRKIQLKVNQPGVTLDYRRGYYADDPNRPAKASQVQHPTTDPAPYSVVETAMIHGAPSPAEIVFLTDVHPSVEGVEPAVAEGNKVNPKAPGPYRRFTVNFLANARDVAWEPSANGTRQCAVEFLAFVYDADGVLVNTQTSGIGAILKEADYLTNTRRVLHDQQQISVPAKGEYYLRLGIHDMKADRVGALELPVSAVMNLPTATQAGTPKTESSPR